jgi:uncharacterized membrane protein
MLKKVSLSAMVFTYLFAGIYHFTRFDYFLSLVPPMIPFPAVWTASTGAAQILLAFFFTFQRTRKVACYTMILLTLAFSIPLNICILARGGAAPSMPHWAIAGQIPFDLVLCLWAYWHSREP